jgi:hypothetical protein
MKKKRGTHQPRIVGIKVMMQDDFERLHKYMLEIERVDAISDEMRAVVESEWPALTNRGCVGQSVIAAFLDYSPRFNISGSLAMFDATRLASSIVICFASMASASAERP